MSHSEPCSCSTPGFCPRYQRRMIGRLYELCSGHCPAERPCTEEMSMAYRAIWDAEAAAGNPADVVLNLPSQILAAVLPQAPADGPGTELKKLLALLGAEA